jgi:hypothetical protein
MEAAVVKLPPNAEAAAEPHLYAELVTTEYRCMWSRWWWSYRCV